LRRIKTPKKGTKLKSYSVDLRERIIHRWKNGVGRRRIASVMQVSFSTVNRYIDQFRKTGHLQPKVQGRMQPRLGDEQLPALEQQLAEAPDATLEEHVARWEAEHGIRISVSTMWRAMERVAWTRKKRR
jgi:transposase